MDKVNKKLYKFLFTLMAGTVIGMLIGVASTAALVSYRIDTYHEEIQYLKTVIEDKDTRLKKLEESINKRRYILKEIAVRFIFEGEGIDDIDKMALEKHIKEKYNKLLGKEVKTIDIEMAADIIDDRIMKINKKEYKLKVDRMMLTDVLEIWVKVSQLDPFGI